MPPQTKTAAVYNICRSATASVNGYVNFPLGANLNTEYLDGPDFRATVQNSTGVGRILLQRWPVTQITGVSVSPAKAFPRTWTALPAGAWDIEVPILGHYGTNTPTGSGEGGQAILIAPGYLTWNGGRWGTRIQISYIHGWPHTVLTATATAGTTSLTVEDITGWAPASGGTQGAAGVMYDINGGQETISCTTATPASGSIQAGPGTLTLKSALAYTHAPGILVSSLPANVIWATSLYAAAEALTRGAQATQLRSQNGAVGPATGAEELKVEAELILAPYRRSI